MLLRDPESGGSEGAAVDVKTGGEEDIWYQRQHTFFFVNIVAAK
jgi:hypothetical protein